MSIEVIRLRRYPEVERAFCEATSGIFKKITERGFIGRFNMRSQPEGGPTTVVETEEGRNSFQMKGYRGEILVTDNEILETNISEIQKHMIEAALKFAETLNAGFFKQMTEIVNKHGQKVKASSGRVTENVIRGLKGMPFTFDNDRMVDEGLVLYIPAGQVGQFFVELGMKEMAKEKTPTGGYMEVRLRNIYEWCLAMGENGTKEAKEIVMLIGEKRKEFDAEESNRKLVD